MIPQRVRWVAGLAAGVLVVWASIWAWRAGTRPDVPTIAVASGPFERHIEAEGNLKAAQAAPVIAPFEAQGQLKVAWLVPDGSKVKAGDVVVRFDPTEMERTLRDGQADESTAESRMKGMTADAGGTIRNLERDAALARKELEGSQKFKVEDPDVFSRQEIIRSRIDNSLANQRIETSDAVRDIKKDAAKVDLDLLDIERRKAGIAIDRARKGLESLEIKAPHDGILVYQRDWKGEITKVGDTVWPGEPVAEIPELGDMEARVFVLEADAGGLAPGIPASVVIEAHPETVYNAKIKKLDALAARRTGWLPVQYFGATLELAKTEPTVMKPGQRVRATLVLDRREEAISVPRSATFERGGKTIVWKRTGGSFEPVEVALGPAAIGRVVVERGLAKGDVVALADPTAGAGGAR